MSKFCTKCGTEMDNHTNFCPKCGAAIIQENATQSNYNTNVYNQTNSELKPINILGLISVCLAGVTLFLPEFYYDLILSMSLAAIVLGIIGLAKSKKYVNKAVNKALPIIGLCVGALAILVTE